MIKGNTATMFWKKQTTLLLFCCFENSQNNVSVRFSPYRQMS